MDDKDFEGTIVLEMLARIDRVEEFMDAVDDDDYPRAAKLMISAGIDRATIDMVLKKMTNESDEH